MALSKAVLDKMTVNYISPGKYPQEFGMDSKSNEIAIELEPLIKEWLKTNTFLSKKWTIIPGYPGFLIQLNSNTYFEIRGHEIKGVEDTRISRNELFDGILKGFKISVYSPSSLDELFAKMILVEEKVLVPVFIENFSKPKLRFNTKSDTWEVYEDTEV